MPLRQRESELRRRVEAGSKDSDDFRDLAQFLYRSHRYEGSLSLFQDALKLPLTNVRRSGLLVEMGWLLYEVFGRREEARCKAEEAVSLLSREVPSGQVPFLMGFAQTLVAHSTWHQDSKAGTEAAVGGAKWLDQALLTDPKHVLAARAYYDLARLQVLLGKADMAIQLCEKSLELETDDVDRLSCLIVRANALRLTGQFVEAEQTWNDVLRHHDLIRGPVPHYELGLVQRALGRPIEARASFERARVEMRAPFNDPQLLSYTYVNLAELHFDIADYRQATAFYREALALNPSDDYGRRCTLSWLAECHMQLGQYSEARTCFREILDSRNASASEKDRVQVDVLRAEAELLWDAEKHEEARATYLRILDLNPIDDVRCDVLVWLGEYAQTRGEHAEARRWYEQVLESCISDEHKKPAERGLAELPPLPRAELQ